MKRLPTRIAAAGAGVLLATAASGVELEPIPEPNLDDVESAIVEQLTRQRGEVERLATAADSEPAALAEAMGRLGELYILYELLRPAEVALVNASHLAPADFRWPYLRATIVQEQRRLEQAGELLREVLELETDYLPALIRLGEVASAAGEIEAARRWFQRALEVAPGSPAANWGLGQLAYGAGQSAAAVEHFEAVLEIQPGASAVHYPLGLAYRDLGRMEEARRHLARRGDTGVDKVDPLIDGLGRLVAGSSLYMVRGNQAFARGNLELAVTAYRAAVEADRENVVAREALASALSRSGDLEAALEQLDWVIANGHASAGTYYNLATIESQQGRVEASLEHFRQALELDPELIDAHFNLGLLLERIGRGSEALSHYDAVLALDPQDIPARVRRAALAARQGGTLEAEASLTEVLAIDPGNAEALLALAELQAGADRLDEALETYRRIADGDPAVEDRARAHYGAGRALLAAGRTQPAIEELSRAVELMPRIAEARLTLAHALGRAGRFAEAAVAYGWLLEQNPAIREAQVGRAISLLLADRDREALTALREGLEALPDDESLGLLLARLLAASSDEALRDGEEALALAERLFRRRQSPESAETLAMALAEVGRFTEAAELQNRLLEEARRAGADTRAIAARLQDYRRRVPARDPWRGEE